MMNNDWASFKYIWQDSQAVPLTNITNVLGEANSVKTTRRLHFQDELPAGTAESSAETGHTVKYNHSLIYNCRLICWEKND